MSYENPNRERPKQPDQNAEMVQAVDVALEQLSKYQDLQNRVREAERAKKRHGALDDQIDEMRERGECTNAGNFFDNVCGGIPEIILEDDPEEWPVKMKVLPDGRIVRVEGSSAGNMKIMDRDEAVEEILEARRRYNREIDELTRRVVGIDQALEQLGSK